MPTLASYLTDPRPAVRLRAVMAAGTTPSVDDLELLVEQCAVEPDLQVREMLTWALVRLPAEVVVPRLVGELERPEPQARSQALHTLSKIRDGSVYPQVAGRLSDVDPVSPARPGAPPSCWPRSRHTRSSPGHSPCSSARAARRHGWR